MEALLAHWSTFANGSFWIMLIALDMWILRKFSVHKYRSSTFADDLRPYLKTRLDTYLWVFIYMWFMILVLLETYSLFNIWAGCFVGCLDEQMKGQNWKGRAFIWFLLLMVPSLLLLSVAVSLAYACASVCELLSWTDDHSADLIILDEEKAPLITIIEAPNEDEETE